MVCCIATLSTANCSPICGKAGNMVSMENGPIMARPPRIIARRARDGVEDWADMTSTADGQARMLRGRAARRPEHGVLHGGIVAQV